MSDTASAPVVVVIPPVDLVAQRVLGLLNGLPTAVAVCALEVVIIRLVSSLSPTQEAADGNAAMIAAEITAQVAMGWGLSQLYRAVPAGTA